MYQLSGEALRLADHLIVIMSFVMVDDVLSDAGQSRFYTAVVKAERIYLWISAFDRQSIMWFVDMLKINGHRNR